MTDLLVIGREVRRIQAKPKMCVLFRHVDFENITLYCTKQYGNHVVKEGDAAGFFDRAVDFPLTESPEEEVEQEPQEDDIGDKIPSGVFNMSGANSEDITHVRNLGFEVDDDNDSAPDNIPNGDTVEETNQSWGWNGIDYRAQGNVMNVNPTLNHGLPELLPDPDPLTLASLFITFFLTELL